MHLCRDIIHIWIILELRELPLECYRVINPELRSAFENHWDGVLAEVPAKGVRDIGEHEGNVVRQRFREGGEQGREREVQAASAARDSAIGED